MRSPASSRSWSKVAPGDHRRSSPPDSSTASSSPWPLIVGAGTEAVQALGIERVADGIRLENRMIVPAGEDVMFAWDVVGRSESSPVLSAATR